MHSMSNGRPFKFLRFNHAAIFSQRHISLSVSIGSDVFCAFQRQHRWMSLLTKAVSESGGNLTYSLPRLCSTWKRHTYTDSTYTPTSIYSYIYKLCPCHKVGFQSVLNFKICVVLQFSTNITSKCTQKEIINLHFAHLAAWQAGKTMLTWVHPN